MEYYRQISGIDNDQIFDTKYGDVNGDGIPDTIYLVGQKAIDPNIGYIKNIKIVVQDGKTKELFNINLKSNSGYNPHMLLLRFTKSNVNSIIVSIDSGAGAEYKYFYIYSFINNIPKEIFNYEEFNNRYHYDVNYLREYKVEIINHEINKRYLIDIVGKGVIYLKPIYNPDGTLKLPKRGRVTGLTELHALDLGKDGIFELSGTQRILGMNNNDVLGRLETPLHLIDDNLFVMIDESQYITTTIPEV
jgi:hypothetical protein